MISSVREKEEGNKMENWKAGRELLFSMWHRTTQHTTWILKCQSENFKFCTFVLNFLPSMVELQSKILYDLAYLVGVMCDTS